MMTAASLAVAMIGHALAQARGLVTKHAVKQVDRLLSNNAIGVWDSCKRCFATLGLQRLRMGFRAPSSMASTRQCAFEASR
jgi:hypothetical protein